MNFCLSAPGNRKCSGFRIKCEKSNMWESCLLFCPCVRFPIWITLSIKSEMKIKKHLVLGCSLISPFSTVISVICLFTTVYRPIPSRPALPVETLKRNIKWFNFVKSCKKDISMYSFSKKYLLLNTESHFWESL